MHTTLKRSWWVYVVRGVLAILFGLIILVAAIFWPGATVTAMVLVFGAYIFFEGLLALVGALRHRGESGWGILVFEGLAGMAFGVFAFLWTAASALVLVILIAAWALVTGALEVAAAIRLRKVIRGEWRLALTGVLSMALGVLVLFFPWAGALGVMWLIATYAILYGSTLVALGFEAQKFEQLPPEAEAHTAPLHPHPDRL